MLEHPIEDVGCPCIALPASLWRRAQISDAVKDKGL